MHPFIFTPVTPAHNAMFNQSNLLFFYRCQFFRWISFVYYLLSRQPNRFYLKPVDFVFFSLKFYNGNFRRKSRRQFVQNVWSLNCSEKSQFSLPLINLFITFGNFWKSFYKIVKHCFETSASWISWSLIRLTKCRVTLLFLERDLHH